MSFFTLRLDGILTSLKSVLNSIGVRDIVDILAVSLLVYFILRTVKNTRAIQIVKGFLFFIIFYIIVSMLKLKTMIFILNAILTAGLVAIVVVFQPELRRTLEQMGRFQFRGFGRNDAANRATTNTISSVVTAAVTMASTKTGALIVWERKTGLADIMKTGTIIDGVVTPELLMSLFYPNAPLHDGAVVVGDNLIRAAGCYLPLSSSQMISRDLGTRHRAALGMSENSDAITIVVSEETGNISVTLNGILTHDVDKLSLRRILRDALLVEKKNGFHLRKKGEKNNEQNG